MILDAINRRRALHDSRPLKWSIRAAEDAFRHAQEARNDHDPPGHEFSSSLGRGWTGDPMFYIWQWYEEEEPKFDYSRPLWIPSSGPVGHFSQMVWRSYQYIGCAMVEFAPPYRNRFKVQYHMTCMQGPMKGEFYNGYYPANVVPLRSTWPIGWQPPLKSLLDPRNERFGPPWSGYKYAPRRIPKYTGETLPEDGSYWKPIFRVAAPPYWDESRRPRYDEVRRTGGGQVEYWEEGIPGRESSSRVHRLLPSTSRRTSSNQQGASTSWQHKFAGDFVPDDFDAGQFGREDTSGDEDLARALQASLSLGD